MAVWNFYMKTMRHATLCPSLTFMDKWIKILLSHFIENILSIELLLDVSQTCGPHQRPQMIPHSLVVQFMMPHNFQLEYMYLWKCVYVADSELWPPLCSGTFLILAHPAEIALLLRSYPHAHKFASNFCYLQCLGSFAWCCLLSDKVCPWLCRNLRGLAHGSRDGDQYDGRRKSRNNLSILRYLAY